MTPKLVYLDANDFSDLSKPEPKMSAADSAILSSLRTAKQRGLANFYISPIHISEAVHAAEEFKDAAVRRAKLMEELGSGNILRTPYNLCKIELDRALDGNDEARCSFSEIISNNNEWFGMPIAPPNLAEHRKEIGSEIDKALVGKNRHERRAQKAKLNPNRKSSHAYIRSLVKKGLDQSPPSSIPLGLLNPKLALDWYLGEATNNDFREHSLRIASNPYLLFRNLIDELGQREKLYRVTRDQGAKWVKFIETATSEATPLLTLARQNSIQFNLRSLVPQITNDSFWRKVVGSLAERDLSQINVTQIQQAKDKSPSTTILVHILLEAVVVKLRSKATRFASGDSTPVTAKESDYADFMHAMYAPYFDVFRCDSKTAELLSRHSAVKGKIVSKRSDLLKLFD